ncbi:hypothetical protein Avbf_09259 [Armadillidium vulgare]|nr:hypothetical protein Avbf_09259 [Armadillidium vulgare]
MQPSTTVYNNRDIPLLYQFHIYLQNFNIAFLIYLLAVKPDFEANSTFSTTNQCSLAIVLISWGFLYFKYRALFSQHVYYKEYLKLIVW